MSDKPSVEILGAHRIPVTQELIEETLHEQFGEQEEYKLDELRQVIDELLSVVLIEALVRNPDERWNGSFFTQTVEFHGTQSEQAQWNERAISEDGETLLESVDELSAFRILFYLHFFDPSKAIDHAYGSFIVPALTEIPTRLTRLTSYVPVD